jgi:hypothetical protein
MPTILIAVLAFYSIGFKNVEPYAIMALLFFSQHFHYKSGYAMAYCGSKGVNLD